MSTQYENNEDAFAVMQEAQVGGDPEMAKEVIDPEVVKATISEVAAAQSAGLSQEEAQIAALTAELKGETSAGTVPDIYGRSIQRERDNITQFLERKTKNLERRMNGEISGVELDRLDKELDGHIQFTQSEIDRLVEVIKDAKERGAQR